MTINHFPQASAIQNGVRLSDYNDAPIDPKGQPNWCSTIPCQPGISVMLRPDLVFAYLEDPPSYVKDDGFGADWDWTKSGDLGSGNQLSNSLRAKFDGARASGASVSEAASITRPDDAFTHVVAELSNNEAAAKSAIQLGAFDTGIGLPLNYTTRREMAIRAGLSQADVAALGNAPSFRFNPALFASIAKRPLLINPSAILRAFGAKPGTPVPPTTTATSHAAKIAEVVIAGIFGVGAILGVLWGVKKL